MFFLGLGIQFSFMTLAWNVRSLGYYPSTANICMRERPSVCVYVYMSIHMCALFKIHR